MVLQKNLNGDLGGDFVTILESISADTSIPPDTIIGLFLDAIAEMLSTASGLALSLTFEPDKYLVKVYAVRKITEEGLGFGEISLSTVNELKKTGYKDGFVDGDSFKQYLRSIFLNTDSEFFSRTIVNKVNESLKLRLTEVVKEKEFNIFKDKEGELISGTVSRIESGNIIVNVGLGEAFLSKHEIMPGEFFGIGSSVQAYIYEVSRDIVKYQIKLSRTRPEFLGCLMASMIPEIENGLIEIKSIARDPGSRSKVAVYSDQSNIDAVGSCIGRDGIRIKAIRALVANERIDVVKWDPDIAVFIGNALAMDITKFVFHPDGTIEVVFSSDNLYKAKANRQQQVRLVSRLTKRRIKLTSFDDDKERTRKEQDLAMEQFQSLGLSEFQSSLLLGEDIKSAEDILDASEDVLLSVLARGDGVQMSLEELRRKAESMYNTSIINDYTLLGIDAELAEVPHVAGIHPSFFKNNNVLSKSMLAEMDSDEVKALFRGYLAEDPELEEAEAEDIVRWSRGETVV